MAVRDFRNEEDVRESNEMSKQDSGKYIKIDSGKTPFYVMDTTYSDGYVHWVKLPNGDNKKVTCLASMKDKGYNPDVCPVCRIVADQGKEWRALAESGRLKASGVMKEKNRRMTSKYEMNLLVAKGEMVYAGGEGANRKMKPDMSNPTVGIMTLNAKQKEVFLGLAGNPQYPFMANRGDLFNRVILAHRQKTEVDWSDEGIQMTTYIPSKTPSAKPKVEWDTEEMDLAKEMEQDEEQANKVARMYLGEIEEDDEIEFEDEESDDDVDFDDEADAEDFDTEDSADDGIEPSEDDDEDDEADGFEFESDEEAETVELPEPDAGFDDSFLDDVDDDFEDDMPWENDEEEPAIPKAQKKSDKSKSKQTTARSESQSKPSATAKSRSAKPQSVGTSVSSGPKSSTSSKAPRTTSKPSPPATRKQSAGTTASSKPKGAPKKSDF